MTQKPAMDDIPLVMWFSPMAPFLWAGYGIEALGGTKYPKGIPASELSVGDRATSEQNITERDIEKFADVTGDKQPVHLDEAYARETPFGGRIAHGMLTAGAISRVLGMQLPGPGTVYLKQNLAFMEPVRPGDTITTEVEVTDVDVERNRVRLATHCRDQHGETVLRGEALVMPPKP